MPPTIIEDPIINSAFEEPARHFAFDDDGITSEIVEERRPSSYFVPIPAARKRGGQQVFDAEWTKDRIEENAFINRVREKVSLWRRGGHQHVTPTTRRLLDYWSDPARDRKLFFCQLEALETAIYLTEAAGKVGDHWIANDLTSKNEDANPGLYRVAHKMATGTGKTVVMAMLIAWQTLNKAANAQDARFTDSFLVVSPGITIRDRLRVLLPSDPGNYYRERDLVPPELHDALGRAQIVITNFHQFQRRESSAGKAAKLTKQVLAGSMTDESPFLESPDQMVRRVCRDLGSKKNIVVLNDEAHHCYRRRVVADDEERLTGDDRVEAKKRDEEARVWISGLEAVQRKIGIKTVYDLSATPFFLRGSGYAEGTLFPWVVSDLSLIDAIESGVVKVPRVPVSDDAMLGTGVTYRDLWIRIREDLPKKGRRGTGVDAGKEPELPPELQGALHSLYTDYEKAYESWQESEAGKLGGSTPPVFIVVCNNTAVSKLVFDYIAGWEKRIDDGRSVLVDGALRIFNNVDGTQWARRPSTILVDSEQLESGEAMSAEFKAAAAHEIDDWKREYATRFPGRDVDDLTDQDLLREVMNTVGKAGKLGEPVKCVVSVSMLTEGWDANTVTHILGVRAFGTQLLCEQVVGRGLRRRSYTVNDDGRFDPEYAEVYGVPFAFIPTAGVGPEPVPPKPLTRVRALESRADAEITFPRVVAYRYEIASEKLEATFDESSALALSSADLPTTTTISGVVGVSEDHTLDDLRAKREQEVAFRITERLLGRYLRGVDEHGHDVEKPWLFPQALAIVKAWMATPGQLTLKDGCFPQLLLIHRNLDDAVDRIYRTIVASQADDASLRAVVRPFDPVGSTRYVDFDTSRKDLWVTNERCHVSHVVGDSNWEVKLAQALEDMPEVVAYVKNQGLGFTIPYTIDGEQREYVPDFIVRMRDASGLDEPINLVIEVSGAQRRDKDAKVATSRQFWVPAVNGLGEFGRWDYVEITDPWEAQGVIRAHVDARSRAGV